MGEFNVDDLVEKRLRTTPLFAGSRRDRLTGEYYSAPQLPEEETTDDDAPVDIAEPDVQAAGDAEPMTQAAFDSLLDEYLTVAAEMKRLETRWRSLRDQITRECLACGISDAERPLGNIRIVKQRRLGVRSVRNVLPAIVERGLAEDVLSVRTGALRKALATDPRLEREIAPELTWTERRSLWTRTIG